MQRKLLFIVSLFVILFASWANVVYFGYVSRNHFSPLVNQLVHCACLLLTYAIGYINWRGSEKWLNLLWTIAYGGIFLLVAFLLVTYKLTGSYISPSFKLLVIGLRNRFTEPIPFLVFFIMRSITRRVISGKQAV